MCQTSNNKRSPSLPDVEQYVHCLSSNFKLMGLFGLRMSSSVPNSVASSTDSVYFCITCSHNKGQGKRMSLKTQDSQLTHNMSADIASMHAVCVGSVGMRYIYTPLPVESTSLAQPYDGLRQPKQHRLHDITRGASPLVT